METRRRNGERLKRIMDNLGDTTRIMRKVMKDMMERGDTVQDTADKSDAVAESSHAFRRAATRGCFTRWWLDVRQAVRYVNAKTREFIRHSCSCDGDDP